MEQNVNLTNDIAFRYIFGAKQNADLLRSLLNAILVPKGATTLRKAFVDFPTGGRAGPPNLWGWQS